MAATDIGFGDEIVADSTTTLALMGLGPLDPSRNAAICILSRDGSRRIVRVIETIIVNTARYPVYLTFPLHTAGGPQRWEGVRYHAMQTPIVEGQKRVLWNYHERRLHEGRKMVGLYCPYTGTATSELSADPINGHGHATRIRSELAEVANGWDRIWHSRYIFSDHVRQQVTSRLIDGMLSLVDAAALKMAPSSNWRALLPAVEALHAKVRAICIGDPEIWSRELARKIDGPAFMTRLQAGELPDVNMATTPWSPGLKIAEASIPKGSTVNATREIAARWHDAQREVVESSLLPYYDTFVSRPEEQIWGYAADTHEHEL